MEKLRLSATNAPDTAGKSASIFDSAATMPTEEGGRRPHMSVSAYRDLDVDLEESSGGKRFRHFATPHKVSSFEA